METWRKARCDRDSERDRSVRRNAMRSLHLSEKLIVSDLGCKEFMVVCLESIVCSEIKSLVTGFRVWQDAGGTLPRNVCVCSALVQRRLSEPEVVRH